MYGKALEIRPMKVWKLPKGKEGLRLDVCRNGTYFGQIKKDGFWYMFDKDIEGNCFLFARDESVKTPGHLTEKSKNVPHIIGFLNEVCPNGTIVIGEIYNPRPGMTSKDVGKIMGALPDKAIARQKGEYGYLHYYIHDLLMWDGKSLLDKTNWERYNELLMIWECHEGLSGSSYYLPDYKECFVELADSYEPRHHDLNKMIDDIIESGGEGMVLKSYDGKYMPGKKPAWNMIKFKAEDEGDVICLGFNPPKKEYAGTEPLENWKYWMKEDTGYDPGDEMVTPDKMSIEPGEEAIQYGYIPVTKPYWYGWIGSIRVGVKANTPSGDIVEIGDISSGFTDEDLEEIKKSPSSFIGKCLSIQHMPTAGYEGTLRHSRFIRWRDDLNQADCTYEKLFG